MSDDFDASQRHTAVLQIDEAVWVSLFMSAMAGVIAVTLMIATFYCIRYQEH